LRGAVLPIGGLREKVVAAVRAGIKEIIVPSMNKKDLKDIPEDIREKVRQFHFVDKIDEVLKIALMPSDGRRVVQKK
jgi:ATP-dependent Lon protease